MGNSGTSDLLGHILQCCRVGECGKDNCDLSIFISCLIMMYKYYSCLGFPPTKYNEAVKDINNEIFNNMTYFVKHCLHVNCLQVFLYTMISTDLQSMGRSSFYQLYDTHGFL